MTPRRILITGGAGFIGARLARRLAARGDDVLVLDDLSAASTPPRGSGRFLRADVRDPRRVAAATAGRELVVHLASVVGVEAVLADPARTGSVIREGTAVMLGAALRQGCEVLAFSSSEVTDAPRRGPRAIYAEAKRDAEELLLRHSGELPVTIVRPFNVVGPGQSAAQGMVLAALAAAARRGAPLPVHGDGSQQRGFLHVDDLVDTLVELLAQPPGHSGEVLEIGSPQRIAIRELAERVAGAARSRSRPAPGTPDGRREDAERRVPDLRALQARVRFAPRRGLRRLLADVTGNVLGDVAGDATCLA